MHYYKIIGYNYERFFNYKIGLNSLSDNYEEFNLDPHSSSGGLYFCDIKDIFTYLNYGDKVCTVEIPEDARVVRVENGYKSDKIIITSIQDINYESIKNLIDLGADLHKDDYRILEWASRNGHIDIVRLLLEHGVNIHTKNDEALKLAIRYGHIKVVKLLLEHGAYVSKDTIRCAYRSSAKVAKLLLEHKNQQGSRTCVLL